MFQGWDSFYILVGSASAGLTGLLFVVVTLTTGLDRSQALRGSRIYVTPIVFHFAVVLTMSALASVPGLSRGAVAGCVAAVAAVGLAYAGTVTVLLGGRKTPGPPHWTDLWCYGVAPSALYLGLGVAAVAAALGRPAAAYILAAVLLGLLLLGIRNAWDLITWLAPHAAGAAPGEAPSEAAPPPGQP